LQLYAVDSEMPASATLCRESGSALQAEPQSREMRVAWVLGAVALLIQVLTNGRYGYFRDELYFLACSDYHSARGTTA
jgi:hypothetical protein